MFFRYFNIKLKTSYEDFCTIISLKSKTRNIIYILKYKLLKFEKFEK